MSSSPLFGTTFVLHGTTILGVKHSTGMFVACDGLTTKTECSSREFSKIRNTKKAKTLEFGEPKNMLGAWCGNTGWVSPIDADLQIKMLGKSLTPMQCAQHTRDSQNDENYHSKAGLELPEFFDPKNEQCGIIFATHELDPKTRAMVPRLAYGGKNEAVDITEAFYCAGSGKIAAEKELQKEPCASLLDFQNTVIRIEEAMLEAALNDGENTGGTIRIKHIDLANNITLVSSKSVEQLISERNRRRSGKKEPKKRKTSG